MDWLDYVESLHLTFHYNALQSSFTFYRFVNTVREFQTFQTLVDTCYFTVANEDMEVNNLTNTANRLFMALITGDS